MKRPGAELLAASLVAAERRGKPGPARDAALAAAAAASPDDAAVHVLDAVYGMLQAGEPRRALVLLNDLDAGSNGEAIGRRARACRSWATALDYNWYPGDIGAEFRNEELEKLDVPFEAGPGDGETRLVEACVLHGPVSLLGLRSLVVNLRTASRNRAMREMAAQATLTLRNLQTTAMELDNFTLAAWSLVAQSDLLRHAGLDEPAEQQLRDVRAVFEEVDDAIGLAGTYLVEGDWYATPGSSPEALGFLLDSEQQLTVKPDTRRACACYERAGAILDGADAPVASGALALRRAALAFFTERFETQHERLEEAVADFAAAGDEANRRLVEVHRLIADIAQGDIAGTMLRAGTRWDLAPRGPIAEILTWAEERGSRSFATGLARLLQRAGERWQRVGDFDRAEACCSLALPLVSASNCVSPAAVLLVLARLDLERELSARALVRLEQAIDLLDIPMEVGDDPQRWLDSANLGMNIVGAQMNRTGSSTFARGIPGLERAVDRLEKLLRVPGVPKEDATEDFIKGPREILKDIATGHADATFDEVKTYFEEPQSKDAKKMLALASQGVRQQVEQGRCNAMLNRARQLQKQGWLAEAERWYDDAMERIRAAGPALVHLAVVAASQRGKDNEAKDRFDEAVSTGVWPDNFLAPLALRAGRAEAARALFKKLDDADDTNLSWRDLADRAEAALEVHDPVKALGLARRAIERFELRLAKLVRDPDRVAASDDVSAAFLYMVAARACFAIADSREAKSDLVGCREATSQALSLIDRGRTFVMSSIVNMRDDASRVWQQASTEWSSAFERLLFAYEFRDGAGTDELLQELSAADEWLSEIESSLRKVRKSPPCAFQNAVDVKALQDQLPAATCLLEYHVVGPQVIAIGVTREDLTRSYARLERGVLESAVNSLLRSCATGSANVEDSATLSRILLNPLVDVLRACERVIVVPFGPLHSVPFHALPFDGRPLGETHVLSYIPASSLLLSRTIDDPIRGTGAVVVGNPTFEIRPDLLPLPGAAIEAREVARLLGTSDCLVGPQATEDALRPLLVGRAVVHLAAHGHLDDAAPSTSSIVLAGRDELTVSDLIGLRIEAGLAVLSACDTGRGVATLGGDLVGLGRGLLAAGVDRSIVSLWPVDDIVACVTMVSFYDHLDRCAAPARALALAQRDIKNMTSDDIISHYRDLGGDADAGASTRRRSGASMGLLRPRGIPVHPAFEDDDEEPNDGSTMQELSGSLERVWAPFVLIGA